MPAAGSARGGRGLGPRLALAAGAALFAVLLAEGAARAWLASRGEELGTPFWVLDPELGARMQPGYEGPDDRGLPVSINSRGLRNAEVEVPKPAGRLRVVAMGDSVTYGFGVAADEAFPRLLEAELAARGVGDVEVVNAGVPGYSTYQGAVHLERDVLALEPDVVLFAYMNNDRWDSRGDVHTAEAIRAGHEDIALRSWLFYHSGLGRIAIRFQAGGLDGVLAAAPSRRAGRPPEQRDLADVPPPPRLALEPVAADHPRLAALRTFRERVPTVTPERRRALCARAADAAAAAGARLVFVSFYDHPYMCAPLRAARSELAAGRAAVALDHLHAYFTTPPVPGTSAASLMDLDLVANEMLARAYDGLGRGPDQRPHYFPRRPYRRLLLHLDVTYNEPAAEVAAERGLGLAAIELDDLAPGDYLDHVHLSRRGHAAVAARLAERLAGAFREAAAR